MSSRPTDQYTGIVTIYLVMSALFSIFICQFIYHQGKTSGWTRESLLKNKFFVVTGIASFAQLFNMIVHAVAMLYFILNYPTSGWIAMNITGDVLLVIAASCHVILVFSRSEVIFDKESKYITVLKLLVRLFVVSEVAAVILSAIGYNVDNEGVNIANAAFNHGAIKNT
jgi:hypothetical protein